MAREFSPRQNKSIKDMSKQSTGNQIQRPKPVPSKGILLTKEQITIINEGGVPSGNIFKNGGMECIGEGGMPPCYWNAVPSKPPKPTQPIVTTKLPNGKRVAQYIPKNSIRCQYYRDVRVGDITPDGYSITRGDIISGAYREIGFNCASADVDWMNDSIQNAGLYPVNPLNIYDLKLDENGDMVFIDPGDGGGTIGDCEESCWVNGYAACYECVGGGHGSGIIYGCTDPSASNYNSNANSDNGSCIYDDGSGDVIPSCSEEQQGSTPNDNCPTGFSCYGNGYDSICCPPGQTPEWLGSSPGSYTHMCSGGPIQYCGDPAARNYNPTVSSTETDDCIYCDPNNDLGYGIVWDDCDSYCRDNSRWHMYGGSWTKGDLLPTPQRDGVRVFPTILEDLEEVLSSNQDMGYKSCATWAADVTGNTIVDRIDTLPPLDGQLKVLTINAGHLKNIHDSKEPPTSCDDPRCTLDEVWDNFSIDISGGATTWMPSLSDFPNCCVGWTDATKGSEDFLGCSQGCTKNGLCRRNDEASIRELISTQQPDIVVLTELIENDSGGFGYSCMENSCSDEMNNPLSSCYQDGTEQIDRVLPDYYSVSCNNPLYTCIAVRDDVGFITDTYAGTDNVCNNIICDSIEFPNRDDSLARPIPKECFDQYDWPINVGAAHITLNTGTPIRVIGVHPKQNITLLNDTCRKKHLEYAFDENYFYNEHENILIAGDFNADPYGLDVQRWWGWENQSDVDYMSNWIKDMFNNWTTQPTATFQADVPTCGTYTFKIWDINTTVDNVHFKLEDDSNNQIMPGISPDLQNYNQQSEYFELDIGIEWNYLSLKICANDPPGFDWNPFCAKIPVGQGCGDCEIDGTCENYEQPVLTDGYYMRIRYYQNGNITLEPTTACVPGGCLDFTFNDAPFLSLFDGLFQALIIQGVMMVDEIAFEDLAAFSPVNYQTISSGDFSIEADENIVDSGEYIKENAGSEQGFRNGNRKFIHHNHEAGYLPTHSLLMAETLTLDHIMSNFATTDNCETFKFPFMDHHALMCTLNPLGDEYYQRGGRMKRTQPKPSPSSNRNDFTVDTTLQRGVHPETGWYYQQSTQQYFIAPGQIIVADSYWPEQGDALAFFWNGTCVGWSYVGDIQEAQVGGDWYVNAGIPIMIFDGWAVNDNDPMYEYPHNYSSVFPNGRFKYYKASTGQILDLVPPQEYCTEFANYPITNGQVDILNDYGPWLALETLNLEQHCPNIPTPSFQYELDSGWNLVSFPIESFMSFQDFSQPDNTIQTIYDYQTNQNLFPDQFIGQGSAATFHNGMWVGSLLELNPMEGYWVHCPNWEDGCVIETMGQPIGSPDYNLVPGANLISYPHSYQMEADMLLGYDGEGWASRYIKGFVGDGEALIFREEEDRWVGNLTQFKPDSAYWLIRSDESVDTFKWVYQSSSEEEVQRADVEYRELTFPNDWKDMGIQDVFDGLSEQTKIKPIPTQSSAPMIDASMIDVPELSDSRGYLYDIIGWDFQPNVASPATFIFLTGFIEADGEDLFNYTCSTPNNYADINMGYTPGTTEEECDTSCAQSCKEEYPELEYITKRNPTSGMCACYCTTYPLDCDMGFSHSYYYDNEGRYFPNGTMSGRYQENNRGDAVGVFYEGQLLGWDFINNMSYGPAQGGEGYQEVYNKNTLPGVMIPLSFNDGIQGNVSQYPPIGTTLNSSNSEIILYKANTRTFHELVGNSPQDIYNTEIRLEPFNMITIGFTNLYPDGAIVEWIYDEFGNRVGPTENGYNPNMLTFTFGPPIQLPQELPPIEEPPYAGLPSNYCQTDEDCNGRMICINNECKADRPTGQCYCECTGYGEDEYAIQHLYLDNQCFGEVDCANSCGNYCQTLGSYNMTYSQCIDSPTRQNPRQLQKNQLSNNRNSVTVDNDRKGLPDLSAVPEQYKNDVAKLIEYNKNPDGYRWEPPKSCSDCGGGIGYNGCSGVCVNAKAKKDKWKFTISWSF